MCGPENNYRNEENHYQIKVLGIVSNSWSDWLGGMTITNTDLNGVEISIISGDFPDQAALRGVLNILWDLNATLIQVQCVNKK